MRGTTKIYLMFAVNIASWTVIVCFCAVVLFVGYRVFVYDRFVVPSDSMTPTLIPGDCILVNKLIFGARIYKNHDFSEGQPLE